MKKNKVGKNIKNFENGLTWLKICVSMGVKKKSGKDAPRIADGEVTSMKSELLIQMGEASIS